MESLRKIRKPLYTRFFDKVYPDPNTGCWIWAGAMLKEGYGTIWAWDTVRLAHRVSFELYFNSGIFTSDQLVLHKCNNRWCVNPQHLYLGSQFDNMNQAYKQGRIAKSFLDAPKPVSQYDLTGSFIKTFVSIREAARTIPASKHGISKSCKENHRTSGGYYWRYAIDENIER